MTTLSGVPKKACTLEDSDDQFLEPAVETMRREALLSLQTDRLQALLEAAHGSEFQRQRLRAAGIEPGRAMGLEEFSARVPLMSKADVRAFRAASGDPFGGLLTTRRSALTSIGSSSGTTGDAEFFAEIWRPGTCNQLSAGHLRPLYHLGLRPGDVAVGSPSTFRGLIDDAVRLLGATPLAIDTWFGALASALPHIERHRPAYMQIMSPQVVEMEHLAATHDLRSVFASFKGVSFAGEPLSTARRRRLEQDWGVPLFVYASAGDCGTAWECSAHDGYHVWDDEVLTEVIDPETGEPLPDGALGELVATDLDNPAAPMIRFRTGDLVRLDRSPCDCGRTHTRMWVLGRCGDETVVTGHALTPRDLWDAVESIRECSQGLFQIVRRQREVDRLVLRVGYDDQQTKKGELADLASRVAAAVHDAVGLLPKVLLETEAQMIARGTNAKIPRVVTS